MPRRINNTLPYAEKHTLSTDLQKTNGIQPPDTHATSTLAHGKDYCCSLFDRQAADTLAVCGSHFFSLLGINRVRASAWSYLMGSIFHKRYVV